MVLVCYWCYKDVIKGATSFLSEIWWCIKKNEEKWLSGISIYSFIQHFVTDYSDSKDNWLFENPILFTCNLSVLEQVQKETE